MLNHHAVLIASSILLKKMEPGQTEKEKDKLFKQAAEDAVDILLAVEAECAAHGITD